MWDKDTVESFLNNFGDGVRPTVGLNPSCYVCGEFECEGSHFSSGCYFCGDMNSQEMYVYHWRDENGDIQHEDDCCGSCYQYIANGTTPNEE